MVGLWQPGSRSGIRTSSAKGGDRPATRWCGAMTELRHLDAYQVEQLMVPSITILWSYVVPRSPWTAGESSGGFSARCLVTWSWSDLDLPESWEDWADSYLIQHTFPDFSEDMIL
eukprot:s165_g41.t1